MNHFGKGLREDKFHGALKGINVMLMPLLMAIRARTDSVQRRLIALNKYQTRPIKPKALLQRSKKPVDSRQRELLRRLKC